MLKDISARDMLRALDKSGAISLPPPKSVGRIAGRKPAVKHLGHDMAPIECSLADLAPISMGLVEGKEAIAEFKSLIDSFHYLGYSVDVGENMKYASRSKDGALLAVMLFSAAAWSCADRDAFIGWDRGQRARGLQLMANNSRFYVPQWVSVPCLASHALALAEKRISRDWDAKYGHPLAALETFVEIGRLNIRGTCYKAANWIRVGKTTGRGRDGGHHHAVMPEKDIYVRPLHRNFREILKGERAWRR
jgi:hypothetical protein